MIRHRDHFHGSDLEKIEEAYGIRKEDIISFSANVNPLGLSTSLKNNLSEHLDAICSYPDREYTVLKKTIADYCRTSSQNIMVGNGSTELISLIIKVVNPSKSIIVGPTYSEYEHEISLSNGKTLYYPLKESEDFKLNVAGLASSLNESVDLLAICNPNNPTSGSISREDLRCLLDLCRQYDIFVLIDETYIEFADDYERITAIPLIASYVNLAIIRGISKFFASPGLRLGYAITGSAHIIQAVGDIQNAWSINSLAEVAGKLMFTDEKYIAETKALISSERERICKRLSGIEGLKFYPPSANFVLVKITKEGMNADILFDNAIKNNLMIRNCSSFPFLDNTYFRFCFMNPEDNDRLLNVIEDSMK